MKKPEVKLNPKRSVYGPDQFTEEDVLAVAQELEKEDPAKPGQEEEPMSGDDDDGSKSDSCQKKRCSQCQVSPAGPDRRELNYYSFDSSLILFRVLSAVPWSPWSAGTSIVKSAGSNNW